MIKLIHLAAAAAIVLAGCTCAGAEPPGLLTEQEFEQIFPGHSPFYSYGGFVGSAPRFESRREAAMFLANVHHETGGLTIEDPSDPKTKVQGEEIPRNWWHGPFKVKGTSNKISTDWTTTGHTSVAVPVTASGPGAEQFSGTHDNTHVFDVASQALTGP